MTTDPVHHGHAYGTADDSCLDAGDPRTVEVVRAIVDDQLVALGEHRFADFADLAERHRSDFRDTGPVLAQEEVPVEPRETLVERIHAAEHRLLPEVVRELCLAAH